MLSYSQAFALAESWLRIVHGDWLVIIQDRVIKKPYGWVFFYTSKKWLETRDPSDRITGMFHGKCERTQVARPLRQ